MWQCFKHFIYTSPPIQISLSFMKKSHASSRHLYMLVGILSIFSMPCYQIKVESAKQTFSKLIVSYFVVCRWIYVVNFYSCNLTMLKDASDVNN